MFTAPHAACCTCHGVGMQCSVHACMHASGMPAGSAWLRAPARQATPQQMQGGARHALLCFCVPLMPTTTAARGDCMMACTRGCCGRAGLPVPCLPCLLAMGMGDPLQPLADTWACCCWHAALATSHMSSGGLWAGAQPGQGPSGGAHALTQRTHHGRHLQSFPWVHATCVAHGA